MIPRLSPPFDISDFAACGKGCFKTDGAERFEQEFAAWSKKRFALSFPYCRSALYALIRVQGWLKKEIILPAYTCASVPSSIVASGNIPRFVDVEQDAFTMNLKKAASCINENTRAVLMTPMYGFPVGGNASDFHIFDKRGVFSLYDCALGMGTTLSMPSKEPNSLSLYSFSIGKQISTVEGGMAVTNDGALYQALKHYRDRYFNPSGWINRLKKSFFFISSWAGTFPRVYPLTYFLAYKTDLLGFLVNHYDPYQCGLPKDAFQLLDSSMGFLGVSQVRKADKIFEKKIKIARAYSDAFKGLTWLTCPQEKSGTNYSHYPCTMNSNRNAFLRYMLSRGVHVGVEVFDYVAPNLPVFKKFARERYHNSEKLSEQVVLFPNHYGMSERAVDGVIIATAKWNP